MKIVIKVLFTAIGSLAVMACGEAPTDSSITSVAPAEVVFVEIRIGEWEQVNGTRTIGTIVNTGGQDARDVSYVLNFEMTGGRLIEGSRHGSWNLPPDVPLTVSSNHSAIVRAFIASIEWEIRWYSLDGELHEANGKFTSQ